MIRLPYGREMTIAGNLITVLQAEQRIGNVSTETEQHLKHEFRKLGRDASAPTLAAAVEAEIVRLERQAATLRRLHDDWCKDHRGVRGGGTPLPRAVRLGRDAAG